jgi:hypothetical protein
MSSFGAAHQISFVNLVPCFAPRAEKSPAHCRVRGIELETETRIDAETRKLFESADRSSPCLIHIVRLKVNGGNRPAADAALQDAVISQLTLRPDQIPSACRRLSLANSNPFATAPSD